MADHFVTWDHDRCEHDDDCSPVGEITCLAVGMGESMCRYECVDGVGFACESWMLCDGAADRHGEPSDDDPDLHVDPGFPHCDRGHLMQVGDCNAVLFINEGGDVRDSYDNADYPVEYRDSLVDIVWDGECYLWDYAKAPVTQ